MTTTIPLAILAFRGGCPVTEAYLSSLNRHGLRPAVILAVDYVGDGAKAAKLQCLLGTYLSAKLLRRWRNRSARIAGDLADRLQQDYAVKLRPGHEPAFKASADRVIHLTVKDYTDPRLREAMRACGAEAFLYCSGGRVPAVVFEEGFRILHIHPGVVPHVRGSDGLLWSILARQRAGSSCFYMDAGIDTGRLIATAEYPIPSWPGLDVDPDVLYNALIHCYDPHLRASLLIDVLKGPGQNGDLAHMPSTKQAYDGGHYYTMHKALRDRVLSHLCA
ncbi:hypothetical protein [Pararhizobium sp.]|uniref:hypothetical protein n=1 Tax=Pararhizobium sp. TaxID=1977563 RepID=UPI0027216019|nr:hypothetical protein [Pararhizobium sp.]MDO9418346.1 hypothetical protein [Pararhizobium sp.]